MRRRTIVSIHEPAALPGAGNTNVTEVENRVKYDDSDNMYDPDASLARIDAIAAAALSSKSLARYEAYKQVLLAREQDRAAIALTLTLFVSDLTEASDRSAVISRSEP